MKYTRELTALVVSPVAIWIIGWSNWYVFDVVVALIGALALYEFLTLGSRKGFEVHIPVSLILMIVLLVAFVTPAISIPFAVFLTLLVLPGSFVFSRFPLENVLSGSGVAVMATLYVGILAGSILRLRGDFGTDGPKLIFFLLLVVWLGDAFAYYFGRMFGRHALAPRVSPKKTVEGLIAQLCGAVAVAVIIHFTFFPDFPLIHAVFAGLILSAAGAIGDLVESMWKRSAAVKDSGSLLPGHGGFLDRFDSVFFTAPILYIYWVLIQNGFSSLRIMST